MSSESVDPRRFLTGMERFPPGGARAETVSAVEIDNTVALVNERILAPFDIQLGKRAKLGLFINPQTMTPDFNVGIRPMHGRSADIGKVFFGDSKGHIYRDVDIKGSGSVSGSAGVPDRWNAEQSWDTDRGKKLDGSTSFHHVGLLNREEAEDDFKISEIFTSHGIRTHRTIAILKLNELPVYRDGERTTASIETLKKDGSIDLNFEPVIQIRAFGVKTRVSDLLYGRNHSPLDLATKESTLNDALGFLSFESKSAALSISQYLTYFAETLGKNIGLMHKFGFTNRDIKSHNVTLDCRCTDLDSIEEMDYGFTEDMKNTYIRGDVFASLGVLKELFEAVAELKPVSFPTLPENKLTEVFKTSYQNYSGLPFPK